MNIIINTVNDSLVTGDINAIELPYCMVNTETFKIKSVIQTFYLTVKEVFEEAEKSNKGMSVFFE